jgi:outer membrane protein assembly factor BamB/HEAT repeat protein
MRGTLLLLSLMGLVSCASEAARTEPWVERLTSNDPRSRAEAADELARGGERSLPIARRLLDDPDPRVRQAGFEIAQRIGPPAVDLLAGMLRDPRTSSRRRAADLLIDLAPDTERIQPELCRALDDPDRKVACDAARALGALGERAAPSVPALTEALAHHALHVRLYAAEALASIGPKAAPAATALSACLRDPVSGVRWAACEGLAGIGPAAAPAVPELARALDDETLYVRICAAGALGSIGPAARAALDALAKAAQDPALHAEAAWAIHRITGVAPPSPEPARPPLAVAPPAAAPVREHVGLPLDWNRRVAWSVDLAGETFGRPVLADGVVYLGTDNAGTRNPAFADDGGVLLALRAADGAFLWQDLAPRVKRGLREFLLPSTTSAPYVEGDRLYYLTAEAQLRCLDVRGFSDGENDGPVTDERFRDDRAADLVWELDLCARLGVFPHEACNSEVLPLGDLLVISTSNGRNEGHTRVPSPRAPSLIAVDRRTGDVVWRALGPGDAVLHGQWCSPTAVTVQGRTLVLFGGGDGWLRAYDAPSGREVWRFDGNPKDAVWRPRPGVFSRGSIVASPVHDDDGRVFVAMGEDPSHGNGPSLLHAVSPNGQGDVTDTRRLWTCRQVGRVIATPVLDAGLLYVADLGGIVHCIDARTGDVLWTHETHGAVWGCLFIAGGNLHVGNVEGVMTVLQTGREKRVLATLEMEAPLYARPALAENALFLATARRLYRINAPPR